MDVSNTATIGRSHRGLDSLRDLQTLLAQSSLDDSEQGPKPDNDDDDASVSDVEDIDSETAMNTVYNLLSELGVLNRSNRRAAELLAEKFSVLQEQVSQAESTHSGENTESNDVGHLVPTGSPRSDLFHTPPTTIGSAHASMRLTSPVPVPRIIPPLVEFAEHATQTDVTSSDMHDMQTNVARLGEENKVLRVNVKLLVQSVREQQDMAREYESTLAKALQALRSAAFERHLEIEDVQRRYRELLDSEVSLNRRLRSENADLKLALNNAAAAIKFTLTEDNTTHNDAPDASSAELVRGIYPVSMEASFQPFTEFSDPDQEMRLMCLTDSAYRRVMPSLQEWYKGKQRLQILARYLDRGHTTTASTSDLAQAIQNTMDEVKLVEEKIDCDVGQIEPGAFIFATPARGMPLSPNVAMVPKTPTSTALPELHVDIPTYGFESSEHDDIVDFLIEFGSAIELLGLLERGWFPYLATNCRGELKTFVMDATLLPRDTCWAVAERAICEFFVEDLYKAQLSVKLINMKPQAGEVQRAYLLRVNSVYKKYVRVTSDDGGQLLFWVFHQRLSPDLRAHVDQNLPARDSMSFSDLLKISCDTRVSRNPVDSGSTMATNTFTIGQSNGKVPRTKKWCSFHNSTTHDEAKCKQRERGNSATWCSLHNTSNHDESECRGVWKPRGSTSQSKSRILRSDTLNFVIQG
ncbi:hypothetical protein IW147_005895 [Coemansia sp. RSA 720]|nr:hypothetical protein IW147_005895 [Coemansia sp. RSA 720]